MTVKDFIPLKDYKQTTEKEAKYKPSLAELTTVEKPGRPTSASDLEVMADKPKTKRRAKRPKSKPTKIEKPQKDSILIITEKPQAANKIANALGNPIKKIEKTVSYYELHRDGKKIIIASAVGHLFGLTYSPGQKGWPIFRIEWHPAYQKKNAAFTKKYFDLLKKLAKKAEEVIIATDYDIEGEVIGWNILRFICKKETAKRMKYSTLTKNELERAYVNVLPEPDWGQAYAGETRHILDWLYGINLSRALMSAIKTTGSFKILSIGRVQGPALKIIVNRENEIKNFKPSPYWQVFASINNFLFKHPKDIFEKRELEKFEGIKSGIAQTKESEEQIKPLPPFDLTTLQREAYRLYKISPSQTLKTAQQLYLDGLISYPRTSSQKIPDSIEPKKILKKLAGHFPEVHQATRAKPIEGKKSDPAHPSIYPTGEFSRLEESAQKLYNLVVKRFIAVFCKDAITVNKKVIIIADAPTTAKTVLEMDGSSASTAHRRAATLSENENAKQKPVIFTASGLTIKDAGWTKIYPTILEEKSCPTFTGKVSIDDITFEEKETQPPRRYTPASLITLLEKMNLGTKATRSMIVDTLFERGYLDGRSIQATPLGMRLIESLEKYSPIIIDENLTRSLENEMEKIRDARKDHNKMETEVIEKAKRLITDIAKEFRSKEIEIGKEILKGIEHFREQQQENNTLMRCPTCKKGNIRILYSKKTKRSFAACSAYPACKQTYSLPPNGFIKRSEKGCETCRFPKLLSIKQGKRPWEFCFNPDCPINKKRREEYLAKTKN